MGYTHYWTVERDLTDNEWDRLSGLFQKIINRSRDFNAPLVYEYDQPEKGPEVSKSFVRFNGIGGDGHETFLFSRDACPFSFCKTARKPYDAAVVACLIAAANEFPDAVSFRSDGISEEHADGLRLFNAATDRSLEQSNVEQ